MKKALSFPTMAAPRKIIGDVSKRNWTTVAVELQRNSTLRTGQDMVQLFHDHYPPYGLLVDGFEAASKAS